MGRMRILQDRVPKRCCTLDRVGRTCSHPDRWLRTLCGLWQHLDVIDLPELARMRKTFPLPRLQHDLDTFEQARAAIVEVHLECAELRRVEAAPCSPVEPAAGKDVDQSEFLGEPQRMVKP